MEQHPVPQQISAYEFRLVGDMTLKQFFQVAGGTVIALIFYASPLPTLIKWPLILFFALLGLALAFLPFEERPLSTWIISFFRAIYSPTLYEWKPGAAERVYAEDGTGQEPIIIAPKGEGKARQYLSNIPIPKVFSAFEEAEEGFFKKVSELFQTTPAAGIEAAQADPALQPRAPIPQVEEIPFTPPIKVEHAPKPQPQAQEVQPAYQAQVIAPTLSTPTNQTRAAQATFAPEASPPSPPEQPNTLVGQVLTQGGKIIAGAILEIKDSSGRPVRALKSNKVGHFMAVTPLSEGEYSIETEKEDFAFDTIKFKTEGRIIPPIQIKAK